MRYYYVVTLFFFITLPTYSQVITQWNFNSSLSAPSTGSGTFTTIGGTTSASNNGGGPNDPASPNSAFELSTFPAVSASNKTAGVEIAVSTVGKSDIFLTFDQRPSNTSPKRTTVFYSTNGGSSWTEFSYYDAPTGDGYFSRSYDFSTISALNNNANVRFRLVAAFSNSANTAYQAATSSSNYAASGKWRFDVVTVRSGSGVTVPPGTPNRATELNPAIIGNANGTNVSNGGYGSDLKAVPGQSGFYYGLTDRGPNVSGTGSGKAFPVPGYTPMIGKFEVVGTNLVLRQQITFKDANGVNLNGLPNAEQSTANGYLSGQDYESPQDGSGNALSLNADNRGIDSEGLAAMGDGTFWVSDEYGPYLYHFSATGITLEKVSPISANSAGHKLPAVFLRRKLNNGMEGLCTTKDGSQLVGIMQNKVFNPTQSAVSSSRVVRILNYDPGTGTTRQYVYLLENTGTDVCAIFPVTATDYLVLERDGNASYSSFKKVYRISLTGATDISDPADGASGKLYGGQTVEQLNDATGLSSQGIVTVTKTLTVDLQAAIGGGYPHEKAEGLIATSDTELAVINDDDFGISGGVGSVVPKLDASGTVEQTRLYFVSLASPLPVTYFSFTGRKLATGQVELNWATASEINNAYFELERSTDAAIYSRLGNVPGKGTTTGRQTYSFIDEAPIIGWNYYRLRQVDQDGPSSVSRAVAVYSEGTSAATLNVWPNPASNEVSVSLSNSQGGVVVRLLNVLGTLVRETTDKAISLTDLPTGMYIVEVTAPDGQTHRQRLLKR